MITLTSQELTACQRLIQLGLEEDLGTAGDRTSQAIIPENLQGRAALVGRGNGVLAGLPAAELVFAALQPPIQFEPLLADGSCLQAGSRIALVTGSMRTILAGERTALNFLQHLSGIATVTRRYVDAVAGFPCQILDTRKTTPGWRLLEKYAVRQGGGHNHRLGLYDGILIKDNHLAALRLRKDHAEINALQAALNIGCSVPVEIEVDNLGQLDLALPFAQLVLLDNMNLDDLREAVRRRNARAPNVLLEASGGVTLSTVRDIAATGVDRISVGALTHSALALDIALDYETP